MAHSFAEQETQRGNDVMDHVTRHVTRHVMDHVTRHVTSHNPVRNAPIQVIGLLTSHT